MISRTYFGHQIPGYAISYPDGTPLVPITIPIGLLRLWDTGAVWQYADLNWNGLDGMLALAKQLDAKVLYVLGRPPLRTVVTGTTTVPHRYYLESFLTRLLDHAGERIKYFELWNEPAVTSMYWESSAYDLLDQSRVAYRIIKQRLPNSVILTPSFNDLDSYGYAFAKEYLKLVRGTWWQRIFRCVPKHADGVAFHSYHDPVVDLQYLRQLTDLPAYLTETVATPALLKELAGKVECVVHNAQLEGQDDLDIEGPAGRAWAESFQAAA